MLSVVLIFLYILVTAYLAGLLVLEGAARLTGYAAVKAEGCVMAGLAAVTVYAQVFSLFGGVGLWANLLLLAVCAVSVFAFRRRLLERAERLLGRLKRERGYAVRALLLLLLFLLFAYGTSRGIIHYDTDLYHAQSIRWIEEYGAVKGLGNLHTRLAYNSASFSLSALYSFAFLGGQSYHCAAGFLALLLFVVCVQGFGRRKLRLSDLAAVMGIYYVLNIFDEMVSPASDYFCVLTVFYIVIHWLRLDERPGKKEWAPYALLSLLGVYTMTVKLSAALILLLAVKPARMMIREKKGGQIAAFLGLGLAILLPCLIRNVILSGWPAYPSTIVGFPEADWAVPRGTADYDAREIQVWGRGYSDVGQYEKPFSEWFPSWYSDKAAVDKVFIAGDLAAAVLLPLTGVWIAFRRRKDWYGWLLVCAMAELSFLFWLCSAPLIRYGCVYVWLASSLFYGGLLLRMPWRHTNVAVAYLLLFLGGYKAAAFGLELAGSADGSCLVRQKDYSSYEMLEEEIGGVTFYYPASGDRTGYEPFPASPFRPDILLRGKGLEEGFRNPGG